MHKRPRVVRVRVARADLDCFIKSTDRSGVFSTQPKGTANSPVCRRVARVCRQRGPSSLEGKARFLIAFFRFEQKGVLKMCEREAGVATRKRSIALDRTLKEVLRLSVVRRGETV